jgi:endonuclease/exonuclease/phosphatase family metal-dependent hydrolase
VVRIATWNLENLFRPSGQAGASGAAAYDAKVQALTDTLLALAPDVLAVQEVGDTQALTDLGRQVGGPWHQATADPDRRGIRVGYLSRLPLTHLEQIVTFPAGLRPVQVDESANSVDRMGRPALRARVQVAGRPVDLLTCHLKSKLLTFPGGRFSTSDEHERARFGVYALNRRAAEAATVRATATTLLSADPTGDAALIVLGDLNDVPEAATTQILYGPPGSEIGTVGYAMPDQGDQQRLWNLAPRLPSEQRYSRIYRGRRELIDHILVSHALVTRITDGAVITGPTTAPSIGDDPTERRHATGSDHRPVLADITL